MADEAPSGLPKWQVGVAVGAGLALAATAGYVYYKSRQGEPGAQSPSTASQENASSQHAGTASGRNDLSAQAKGSVSASVSASASGDAAEVPETPLQLVHRCKSRGNQLYKEGKYEEAIVSYREGLKHCPATESSQLSIFYQNVAATYERIAERASEELTRTKHWNEVREACTHALEHNKKYVKAYVRRARSNYMLKDFTEALEDITAANLLESTEGAGGPMRGPSDQVIELASRILKDLGEAKADEYYSKRPPIKVSKTFINSYLQSFYFEVAQFYDVSDDVIAECIAESERELHAIGLDLDGEEYAGPESVKLPVSVDSLGYKCPGATNKDETDTSPAENGQVSAEPRSEAGSTQDEEFANTEAATPASEEPSTQPEEAVSQPADEESASQPADGESASQPADGESASQPADAESASQPEEASLAPATAPQEDTALSNATEEPAPDATPSATEPLEEGEVAEEAAAAETEAEAVKAAEDNKAPANGDGAVKGAHLYMRAVLKYKNQQYSLVRLFIQYGCKYVSYCGFAVSRLIS